MADLKDTDERKWNIFLKNLCHPDTHSHLIPIWSILDFYCRRHWNSPFPLTLVTISLAYVTFSWWEFFYCFIVHLGLTLYPMIVTYSLIVCPLQIWRAGARHLFLWILAVYIFGYNHDSVESGWLDWFREVTLKILQEVFLLNPEQNCCLTFYFVKVGVDLEEQVPSEIEYFRANI